jgi:hypothetical protein
MSISLLKREIEAEISNLETRKKLKKSGVAEEKNKRPDKKRKAPITQTNLKFKLCNVDYKAEKDFTKEGLEMLGRFIVIFCCK